MQEAGRILLMPKGDYSADATYAMLDIVNHNEASWVCKKDCTGQEPSDSNTEFWQRFGMAVDFSNYATLERVVPQKMPSGTDLNTCVKNGVYFFEGVVTNYTNTPNSTAHNGVMIVNTFKEESLDGERITQMYFSPNQNKFYFRTALGSVTAWKPWQEVFTTAGGTVKKSSSSVMTVENETYFNTFIEFKGTNGLSGGLGFNNIGRPSYRNGEQTAVYDLLHTGNKPTGTYTGNGDATERTINTGGIGNVCLLSNMDRGMDLCIVSRYGALGKTNKEVYTFNANELNFRDGVLKITTDSVYVNGSGSNVQYQVM